MTLEDHSRPSKKEERAKKAITESWMSKWSTRPYVPSKIDDESDSEGKLTEYSPDEEWILANPYSSNEKNDSDSESEGSKSSGDSDASAYSARTCRR